MRKSILLILTALTLLAGCKKEKEEAMQEDVTPSFEEMVRSAYDYPIRVNVDSADCILWFNIKVNGEDFCFAIDEAMNFTGDAADFILSNPTMRGKAKYESEKGWFNIVRSKGGNFTKIDVMNEEVPYFNYIYKIFKD